MPKYYIGSNNLQESLLIVATNLDNNFNLKRTEIAAYVGRVLKGIIDDKTITKNLPLEYRRPHGILQTCGLCGKTRIKSMERHLSISHKNKGIKQHG